MNEFNHKTSKWLNTRKSGPGLKTRFRFFVRVFRLFFPQIHDLLEDLKSVQNNKLRQRLQTEGNHFMMSLQPIGKVFESREPDGSEVV